MIARKSILAIMVSALSLVAGVTGCFRHHRAPAATPVVVPQPVDVYVTEAPPRLPQETLPPAPAPGYVWVPGYWAWLGNWVWVRGAWVIPPHPHASYVAGHWDHRGHGYVWISGHWR